MTNPFGIVEQNASTSDPGEKNPAGLKVERADRDKSSSSQNSDQEDETSSKPDLSARDDSGPTRTVGLRPSSSTVTTSVW